MPKTLSLLYKFVECTASILQFHGQLTHAIATYKKNFFFIFLNSFFSFYSLYDILETKDMNYPNSYLQHNKKDFKIPQLHTTNLLN